MGSTGREPLWPRFPGGDLLKDGTAHHGRAFADPGELAPEVSRPGAGVSGGLLAASRGLRNRSSAVLRPALGLSDGARGGGFSRYLQISWADWQGLSEERRAEPWPGRIAAQNQASVVEDLYGLFSRHDQPLLRGLLPRGCNTILFSTSLRGGPCASTWRRRVGHEFNTDGFNSFPALPRRALRRTAGGDRHLLATPVLDVERTQTLAAGSRTHHATSKICVGGKHGVFSPRIGRPGPTTWCFSRTS